MQNRLNVDSQVGYESFIAGENQIIWSLSSTHLCLDAMMFNSWFLSLAKKEFRTKNSRARGSLFSMQNEVHSKRRLKWAAQTAASACREGHRGRRSELAGLRGLRKQAAEAEEGPLETGSGSWPRTSCRCLLLPWRQVSWRTLELRREKERTHI